MPAGVAFFVASAAGLAGLMLARFFKAKTMFTLMVIIGVLLLIVVGSHYHVFR